MAKKTINEILKNPYEFISRLTIINKDGKKEVFSPTTEQLTILNSLLTGDDTLILKPRQIGSSTIVIAYLFWCAYTTTEPMTIAILSHKLKSSKHLFSMARTFYYNLPLSLRKPLDVINSTELRFKDSQAGIILESAGSEGGLRSQTCTKLLLSEFAFSPAPEELLATATSALNNGQLIAESTANYFNDAHHQEVLKAQNGLADWNFLFFPWYEHAEYRRELEDEEIELTPEEQELQDNLDVTIEQLYWRRKKIEKIGWEKFSREYPISIEEAYQQLGDSYFKRSDLQYVDMLSVEPVEQHIFADPNPSDRYAIGVDVAAGVGRDFSVIYVLSKLTEQPVFVYRSNTCTPIQLAWKIQEVSTLYNGARALIESNNMGSTVLNELRHLGFTNIWKSTDDKDWLTTSKTKTEMFELLKKQITSGTLRQIDNITMAEIRALTVNEKGNIALPDNMASHGDSAVALALATVCLQNINLPAKTYLPSWIKTNRAEAIKEKKGVGVKAHRRY